MLYKCHSCHTIYAEEQECAKCGKDGLISAHNYKVKCAHCNEARFPLEVTFYGQLCPVCLRKTNKAQAYVNRFKDHFHKCYAEAYFNQYAKFRNEKKSTFPDFRLKNSIKRAIRARIDAIFADEEKREWSFTFRQVDFFSYELVWVRQQGHPETKDIPKFIRKFLSMPDTGNSVPITRDNVSRLTPGRDVRVWLDKEQADRKGLILRVKQDGCRYIVACLIPAEKEK